MKLFLNVESNKEMYDTVLLTFKPDHLIYTRTHNNPYILAERPENEITLMFPQDITLYIFWHKIESIVYHFPYQCNKKIYGAGYAIQTPLYPSTYLCVWWSTLESVPGSVLTPPTGSRLSIWKKQVHYSKDNLSFTFKLYLIQFLDPLLLWLQQSL